MSNSKHPQQLYWCTTTGHEEDWFIQASSLKEARESHAYGEGFNLEDARAKYICDMPAEYWESSPNWPSHDTLLALGFEFIQKTDPRRVRKDGIIYTEGTYMTSVFPFWKKHQQLLLYVVYLRTTTKYKIGYSANFETRLKQIQSHNPFYVDIVELLPHPLAKRWERELKDKFVNYRTNNEWFDLDKEAVTLLKEELGKYLTLSMEYLRTSKEK